MGDRVPRPGPLGSLKSTIRETRRRLRAAEGFSGTQYASAADAVGSFTGDINTVVAQVVGQTTYTKDQIDGTIGSLNDSLTTIDGRIGELEKGVVYAVSPSGKKFRLGVSDAGATTWTAV